MLIPRIILLWFLWMIILSVVPPFMLITLSVSMTICCILYGVPVPDEAPSLEMYLALCSLLAM